MPASLLPLLLGAILVLLGNAIEEVIASIAEFVHETVLLNLGFFAVRRNGIATDGVLGIFLLSLGLILK